MALSDVSRSRCGSIDGAELRVDDQRARRAIVDHEGEFRPGQAEIERHENRAEPRGGEH